MEGRTEKLDRALDQAPAVVVIEADRADRAVDAADACLAAGFRAVAVATTIPDAPEVIATLAGRRGAVVGATLVETETGARTAVDAGAAFLVAVDMVPGVGEVAREAGAAWIPGAMTPNEVRRARDAGARMVHLFPAVTAGGPAHLGLLRDACPDVEFLAGGGIEGDRIGAWLDAGARAVALADAIYSPLLLAHEDARQIRNHAAAIHREVVRHARATQADA
ncbi:MAG: bifunctional 4-hydroxy-2-oxoglutarate aldolase/2-dehydro-3-deoxy-phosphogluconate aldolase [Myxococcota bacterium]